MKTLIFLLAAALASPAFGQDNTSTTTTTESTSETTTTAPDSYSGTSTDSTDATTLDSESSSLSGTATDETDSAVDSPMDSSDPALSGTATETDSSLSGTTTAPADATAPSATAPATAAPTDQASRTYREDMGEETRKGGFFVEPAVFGSRQDNDLEGAAVGPTGTTDANGFGLDLKLGGHLNEMFFLAADARYERATLEDSALEDTDADVYNWGPTLGFQAPVYGLRAWGTYIVDGVYNPESAANGLDLEFKKPYGWRGGIGIRFATVSLNLEYEDLTYRTTEIDSFGNLGAGTSPTVDFDQRGYAVSLSFPVEL